MYAVLPSINCATRNYISASLSPYPNYIRIQEGKNDPQKYNKIHFISFFKCWMFSFEH